MISTSHQGRPQGSSTVSALPNVFRWLSLLVTLVLALQSVLMPAGRASAAGAADTARLEAAPLEPVVRPTVVARPAQAPQPDVAGTGTAMVLQATTPNTLTLRGPMSGRLKDFTFDRKQPGTVWALFSDQNDVTRSGYGVVKSTDGGATWQVPVTLDHYGLNVRNYIEIDPSDSKLMYADQYKSLDGGDHWLRADSGAGPSLQDLVIAGGNPERLYARQNDSIYRSDDGGVSWGSVTTPQTELERIVGHSTNQNILYAFTGSIYRCATSRAGTDAAGCLYITTDGGTTWRDITPVVQRTDTYTSYGRPYSVVVSGNALYVGLRGENNQWGGAAPPQVGIYRSRDNGTTWQNISTGLPLDADPGSGRYPSFGNLTPVEPVGGTADPNTLFVAGEYYDVATGDPYNPYVSRHRLFVTRNAGGSWQELTVQPTGSLFYNTVTDIAARPGTNDVQVLISMEQRLRSTRAAVDFSSGTFRSTDGGSTWQRSDTGLSNQSFSLLQQRPDGLYAYLTDQGIIKSTDGGATWDFVGTYITENRILVNSIVFDLANPRTIYIGTSNGSRGIMRSTDAGLTWQGRNLGIGASDARMLAIARTSPQTLFAAVGNTLKKSTDAGASWFDIVGAPTNISSIEPHPTNPRILYLRAYNGGGGSTTNLYKTIDGGTTWTYLGNNADMFAIDANNPERLYRSSAPGSNANESREGIDISDDGGATWRTIASADFGAGRRLYGILPANPTIILSVVREATGVSYVPTRTEWSNDLGETWLPLTNFAPNSVVAGPVGNNSATVYMPGGTFLIGRATRVIRGEEMEVLMQEGRAGLWGYTFAPLPGPPPPPPSAELSASTYSVAEGGEQATITVRLSAAPLTRGSVSYETSDGTATAGSDYTATSGTLIFEPGQTSKTFSVPITKDSEAETDETIILELTNPQKLSIGSTSTATLTIVDGGAPPAVAFSAAAYTVAEQDGQATLTIVLSPAPKVRATVNYVTADGTASVYQDYVPAGGTLIFEPGQTSKTVSVAVNLDTTVEQNETVIVTLSDPVNARLGARSVAALTIMDSGPAPTVCFTSATYSVAEGDEQATIGVMLSAAPLLEASVTYYTEDGTATSYQDYTPVYGTLTFAPGETNKSFTVSVDRDNTDERDETIGLSLSGSYNVLTGKPDTATLTIVGDRGNPLYLPFIMNSGANGVAPLAASGATSSQSAAVGGCGAAAATGDPEPPAAATLSATVTNVPGAATGVRLTVTAPDLSTPVTQDVVPAGGTARATLAVPAGSGRLVTAEAISAGGVLHSAVAVVGVDPDATRMVSLSLASAAPVVDCSAPTLSRTQAAPGQVIQVRGVKLPARATVSVLASGVPVPAFVDANGINFMLPPVPALAAGTIAQLRLRVGDQLLACSVPPLEMLALAPAPGENVRVVREVVGLIDDLAAMGIDTEGRQTELTQALRGVGQALLEQTAALTSTVGSAQADAMLAQSGLLAQVRGLRTHAQPLTIAPNAPTSAVHGALQATVQSWPNLTFEDAQGVVAYNQHLQRVQDFIQSPQWIALKNFAALFLGVAAVAGALVPGAQILVPISVLANLALFLVDKTIDFMTRGQYLVIEIDGTPPDQHDLVAMGPAVSWQGGTIGVQRMGQKLTSVDIAEIIFTALTTTLGGSVATAVEMTVKEMVTESAKAFVGKIILLLNFTSAPGTIEFPDDTQQVVLGEAGETRVEPQGRVIAQTGNPGLLQGCSVGIGRVIVSVADQLKWNPRSLAQQASFDMNVKTALAPVAPSTLASTSETCQGMRAVAGGGQHSLAVDSAGQVWAWGSNAYGQLGTGNIDSTTLPVRASGLISVTAVAAGLDFSLVLTEDGTLWAWGRNTDGQVGNGKTTNALVPVRMLSGVVSMAAGERHALALKADGTVWAWGLNGYGQLGDGTTTRRLSPVKIGGLGSQKVIAVSAGRTHSLALTADGQVWAWGYNGFGQLGDWSTEDRYAPVKVYETLPPEVKAIAAGGLHSLALTMDGRVYAWGWNKYGQLGNGGYTGNKTFPVYLQNTRGVRSIAAGYLHSVALFADNTVWAWGENSSGQLGTNSTSSSPIPVPVVQSAGLIKATGIEAGAYHTLAVDPVGMAWAWGQNVSGQLGNETRTNRSVPVPVRQ